MVCSDRASALSAGGVFRFRESIIERQIWQFYDYVKIGYLVNIRDDQLVSVALLTYSNYSIDCGTEIYGYLLDNRAVMLQEHFFGGINYGNSTVPARSIEMPVNYYLYQVTDEGAFRQLLPPGAVAGEDKQP